MLNILHANSSHRFHKCMPKEVHQIYDTLKLMEQQEDTKKVEAKKEEQSNSTNTDKADNKKDKFLDMSV
ncbi:hypothetical protein Q1G38_001777 [Campylobacter jejuni]|uniref:hypothetical protein n=1 Tax=Campylobacter TaxID=194 RepID=UPI00015D036F|nr:MULTISPECIES: hypothetical protein [Campylobacter]EFV10909.1 hypothetical protein CSU_0721 [Campylobacter jejuni subsp. jejuni 327]ABV51991.1 hypothetical protein C8J_0392 [Campylobacter jejuni subsp. jejuni 81116]ADN90621.1 Putative uncharacterized protein [Campylobacter jejuni subsp. jejuni M1]AII24130.1 hypothetical protein MTVDSCj20_0386 [Campylobacter jejuni subsp. jejuni]ALK81022.1 hypothetical protein CJM1cam_0394 [Campylobacter jejuni]